MSNETSSEKRVLVSLGRHVSMPGKIQELEKEVRQFYETSPKNRLIYFAESSETTEEHLRALQQQIAEKGKFFDAWVQTMVTAVDSRAVNIDPETAKQAFISKSRVENDIFAFVVQERLMVDRLHQDFGIEFTSEHYAPIEASRIARGRKHVHSVAPLNISGLLKSGATKKAQSVVLAYMQTAAQYYNTRNEHISSQIAKITASSDQPISLATRMGSDFHSQIPDLVQKKDGKAEIIVVKDSLDRPMDHFNKVIFALQNDSRLTPSNNDLQKALVSFTIRNGLNAVGLSEDKQLEIVPPAIDKMNEDDLSKFFKDLTRLPLGQVITRVINLG